MHCNQIYCYRNTRKKSCSVGTIEEEKARESCGCSAATGRAKWIILHTHTGRVRHGLVGVGGKRLSIFGVTGKTPPLHPHLWLPFQFFLLFFFFFFLLKYYPRVGCTLNFLPTQKTAAKCQVSARMLASFCGPPPNVRMRGTCGNCRSCSNVATRCSPPSSNITTSGWNWKSSSGLSLAVKFHNLPRPSQQLGAQCPIALATGSCCGRCCHSRETAALRMQQNTCFYAIATELETVSF